MCKYCESKKPSLYQYCNYGDLYFGAIGEVPILRFVPRICPPYAECSTKDMNIALEFKINYCPECGEKLN